MSFPKYPQYKRSGIQWLGEVPFEWKLGRLKHLLRIRGGQDYKAVESVDQEGIPVIGSGGQFTYATDYLYDGESVLLGRKGTIDRPLYVTGKFWTVDTMFYTEVLKDTDGRFAYYAATTIPFALYSTSTALPSMSQFDLANHALPLPSEHEQNQIARFLDHETARIDALIGEQQRLIDLLKEKRQAVISHAVTKGLDPTVPMKDSGVEWLGEVPAHWVVIKLGLVTSERCDGPFGSALKSGHYTDDGVRVIRLQNIKSGRFDNTDSAFIDTEYYFSSINKSGVLPGDVLIAGLGDDKNPVGRACVAPVNLGPAMVKADCFRFRLQLGVALSEFVALQLTSGAVADAGRLSTGSTRSRIPLSSMSTRVIALPLITEQKAVIEFVQKVSQQLDSLFREAQGGIELLQERRSALIAAAVTGKIDVRNWQPPSNAPVPELAEEAV